MKRRKKTSSSKKPSRSSKKSWSLQRNLGFIFAGWILFITLLVWLYPSLEKPKDWVEKALNRCSVKIIEKLKNENKTIWRIQGKSWENCYNLLKEQAPKGVNFRFMPLITEAGVGLKVLEIQDGEHKTFLYFTTLDLPSVPHREKATAKPKCALVIDDLGYSPLPIFFQRISLPLTGAVLPFTPFAQSCAQALHQQGKEVLLHLPMEPEDLAHHNPGPGLILTTMDEAGWLETLDNDLENIPYVIGVNNHMGSKATRDSRLLRVLFKALKERGLFFLDSRTTAQSVARQVAAEVRLPFLERQVFLDDLAEPAFIKAQLKRMVDIAKQQGSCIAICHPHPNTFQVLEKELPSLANTITFIPLSHLLAEGERASGGE